jgi:SAM-dependent methyltransferase
MSIRQNRTAEKAQPEIVRWDLISTHGFSLSREYEWLAPLRSYVDSIADFGCWATAEGDICSESFALLWILNVSQIVVIEKNSEYIRNAKEWLKSTRSIHSFFEAYNIIFVEGDMRDDAIAVRYADEFELAFCHNVLYFMQDNFDEIQTAINTMKRVVKPGGWLIAIEEKIGVKYKETSAEIIGGVTLPSRIPENDPTDISYLFESEEWEKVDLPNAPDWSFCYRKKTKAS